MVLLKITNIKGKTYTLNSQSKTYELVFEFLGNILPKKDDVIQIDERLLNMSCEEFCQPYVFELVDKSPRFVLNDKNYLVLKQDDKFLVYERKYG